MKRYILLVMTCLFTLLLTSCASNTTVNTRVRPELSNEYWMQHINLNPNRWTRTASPWFYNNQPQRFDQYEPTSPVSRAITAMTVRVPEFSSLKVDGPFRVQVIGGQDHSSVFILGPNAQARHTVVDLARGNTLYIHAAPECGATCGGQDQVIVRIGMRDLVDIHNNGGLIEGKTISSTGLSITSSGGSVLLTGNMNLGNVTLKGGGRITVIGAYTPSLFVNNIGNGVINLNGRMDVRKIINEGNGAVNILGANSSDLVVKTQGSTLTTLVGYITLRKVDAGDTSRIYMYWVNSNGIYITLTGKAHLGLAGYTKNLDIDANYDSRFQGKYLRSDNIYVRTRSYAHANVNPGQKLFATAMDDSSIYFFSSPNVVSRYTLSNGIIVPIFENCPITAPKPVMKDEDRYKDSGAVYK